MTIKQEITVRDQCLILTSPFQVVSSGLVNCVQAEFSFADDWSLYEKRYAVWSNGFNKVITLLDDHGRCVVPCEVLDRVSPVSVNLVGEHIRNGKVIYRITTYALTPLRVIAFSRLGND